MYIYIYVHIIKYPSPRADKFGKNDRAIPEIGYGGECESKSFFRNAELDDTHLLLVENICVPLQDNAENYLTRDEIPSLSGKINICTQIVRYLFKDNRTD